MMDRLCPMHGTVPGSPPAPGVVCNGASRACPQNITDSEESKPTHEKRSIKIKLRGIDGWSFSRVYKTLAGAQKKAHNHVGKHPDIGIGYAVSFDGVVTCRVEGATLDELFPPPVDEKKTEDA